ncbi:glycosyltransferase family 2 protein [Flavobacterium sp.]|uniref:glycosyltransferase family 2 protein n=1 Tax=Flavobacterium sp. TaxID=239 RepID=UPI003526DE11
MKKEKILVTIFIPVYNGEKYLHKTLTSIKNQTYQHIEVLVVDDSSEDSSLLILNNFASKDERFKIFVKENGGMVSKSINFILPNIKGDFFFYSSQDDIFSENLIEKMVNRHIETKANCVLPDMEYFFEERINNKRIIGLNGDRSVILSGKEALIQSLNWNIHGAALFHSNLVKSEKFPEDAFDSDEYITRKIFSKSNKIVFSEGVFFYRQDNLNAITKTFCVKNFYRLNTSIKLYELLFSVNVGEKYLLNQKINIIIEFLQYKQKAKRYNFSSLDEKMKVFFFLATFKKEVLENKFHIKNINVSLLVLKIKKRILFYRKQ